MLCASNSEGTFKRLVMQARIYRELWWYSKVLGRLIAGHGMSSEWCSKMPGFVQMSDMTNREESTTISIIIKYNKSRTSALGQKCSIPPCSGASSSMWCEFKFPQLHLSVKDRRLPGCGNRVPQWTPGYPSHDDTWSNSSVRMLEVLQNHEWNTSKR